MHYRSNNNKIFDPYTDYSGQTFCHLRAIKPVDIANDGKKLMYEFECTKCGKKTTKWMDHVFFYKFRSCGCTEHNDIIGGVFSRLTVLRRLGSITTGTSPKSKASCYECRCQCGKIVYKTSNALTSRHAKSCGCLRVDQATRPIPDWLDYEVLRKLRHRLENIKYRCYNPNCTVYSLYGARGIRVCDEWLNDPVAFCKWFLSQPGGAEHLDLEVDRYPDQNGPYAPWNCRLAYRPSQLTNRRISHFIDVDHHHLTGSQWAAILNESNRGAIYARLKSKGLAETVIYIRHRAKELGVYDLSDREIMYRIYGEKALDGGAL